ncbi:MAG: retron St85 family RNA-directed DNA polymerase [Geminicoccaceae bacterium]
MTASLLQELSISFGLGAHDLLRIISSAPARYKIFQIRKRDGGSRTIAHPSRELKAIQRFILRHRLVKLPVHPAATGYIPNANIGENARVHLGNRNILKLDFKDFFPSILVRDWMNYARSNNVGVDSEDVSLYSKILFWSGGHGVMPRCLSIGAPTSPILSNILLYEIDVVLATIAQQLFVRYTRYADDITVSGNDIDDLMRFETATRRHIKKVASPRLAFNDEKRGVYGMGERRMVTGLVLTPTHRVSIGRERKRLISAMLHRAAQNNLNPENIAKLKGLLGFCIANEPDYISRMRVKYGNSVVDQVLKYIVPGRPLTTLASRIEEDERQRFGR